MQLPSTETEKAMVLDALKQIVEGLGKAVGANVEFVVHDCTQPTNSVVAIANGRISGRVVGSSVLAGPADDLAMDELIKGAGSASTESHTLVGGYRTRTRSGRELDSTSIFLRDASGAPYAALCINTDRAKLRQLQSLVADLLDDQLYQNEADAEAGADAPAIGDYVEEIIQMAIRTTEKPVAAMTKDDKIEALRYMSKRGLFLIRSGAETAAAALDVSRYSIYKYLDEIKIDAGAAAGPVVERTR